MPIFTTLLLIFVALALLPISIRSSERRKEKRAASDLAERMQLAADLCISAARLSFQIELDHSRASIDLLDSALTESWSQEPQEAPAQRETVFLLAAYIGDVLVRDLDAEWRKHGDRYSLGFEKTSLIVYPFEMVEHKLMSPKQTSLSFEVSTVYDSIQNPVSAKAEEAPSNPPSDETNAA